MYIALLYRYDVLILYTVEHMPLKATSNFEVYLFKIEADFEK